MVPGIGAGLENLRDTLDHLAYKVEDNMPYICANIVYESCSDTGIAIYELTIPQLVEVRNVMDKQTGYIDVEQLSFDPMEDNIPTWDSDHAFSGRIEFVGTWYWPD